jgi:Transposase
MSEVRKRKQKQKKNAAELPILNPAAAGIDIGATEIYVAVRPDRDPEPVRSFSTFTEDLHRLEDWLKACGIETVAMESTGVYWIPLFQILEARGFQVCLVNARYYQNVPGRRTDVSDCQWVMLLAFCWIAAAFVSASGSGLRAPIAGASSGESHSDSLQPRIADAEGVESDEPANPPRHQRYHRTYRSSHYRCGFGR